MSAQQISSSDRKAFDRILDAEVEVRSMQAIVTFRGAGVPAFVADREDKSLAVAKARLSAAVDALTPEQMAAFGQYRAAQRAEGSR